MSLYKVCRLVFVFLLHALLIAKCSDVQEKLIKNLFKSYNKLIRPVRNSSDHVVITMDLVLLQLINVVSETTHLNYTFELIKLNFIAI